MTRALDPRATFDYVLKADRGLEDFDPGKPVFTLRALTPSEEATIQDQVAFASEEGKQIGYRSGSTLLATLRLGLTGWRNYHDASGAPVSFTSVKVGSTRGATTRASDDAIALLHPDVRRELVDAITERGEIAPDEAGKS